MKERAKTKVKHLKERWANSEMTVLNSMLEPDSPQQKRCIWIAGLTATVLTAIPAALYLMRLHSVYMIQAMIEDSGQEPLLEGGQNWYDTGCISLNVFQPFLDSEKYSDLDAIYVDYEESQALSKEIQDECSALEDVNEQRSCLYEKGSQWSKIYWINGVLLSLITIQMACIFLGAFRPWFNFFGVMCAPCVCFAHFCIVVTTAVFRFSKQGKVCALLKLPTYSADGSTLSDEWTYEKDGSLILAYWLLQLFFFWSCLCVSLIPTWRPRDGRVKHLSEKKKSKRENSKRVRQDSQGPERSESEGAE